MTEAVIEQPLNRRQKAKARTRAKVIAAAQAVFQAKPYPTATIRDIARTAGMSTGAVFANFSGKAELWRETMGSEPPLDGPIVRAAPALLTALKGLLAVRPSNWDDKEDPAQLAAWSEAEKVVAQAEERS